MMQLPIRRQTYVALATFVLTSTLVLSQGIIVSAQEKLDLAIRGGKVVDGSGAPWYFADIGIQDGKIARIGSIPEADAQTVIDASGLVVAPGFIDMMGQTASPMLEDPSSAINLLTQGITTINAGEGGSAAPLNEDDGRRAGYTTMAEYFALVESKGLPVNLAQTVGHTQVRRLVLGDVDRRPSDDELAEMQELVREAMQAGAIGVSTALIYPPAIYAQTKEIAALASIAGEYGGRYFTHMRNEGDQLLEAIDEALEIGRQAHTSVHIFHLKTAGKSNWGKMELAIARIKAARSDGHQVTADIYPYVNNGLGISALIHSRHFAEGRERFLARLDDPLLRNEIRQEMESTAGWENWFRHADKDWNRIVIGRSNHARYKQYDGSSVATIAQAIGSDPWEIFFDLVRSDAFALPQTMSDANKILAMQQEFVSYCTDVGPAGGDRLASHPRAFGSFPRILGRYVRDLGVISLERAVSKASAAAANHILAYDRGRIAVGLAADLVIFDEARVIDRADFQNPHAVSEGVKHVIVNGELVLRDGSFTGARPGRVLRGPGYREDLAAYRVTDDSVNTRFANYDRAMQQFMQEHRIPGASIAVTNRGRLVFARGYGYCDIAKRESVTPRTLFRIASLSKPVTAVAILQLVEQGRLDLEDKVYQLLDMNAQISGRDGNDPRLSDITVRHLLEHRGGWDRDQSFDAMFQPIRFAEQLGLAPPADQAAVIQAMLTQPLDFDPGARFAYSNFGYCLLGRIIEKLTDQTYEEYVKTHVLAPLGIATMKLGGTSLECRDEFETRYYHPGNGRSVFAKDLHQPVASPYGAWCLEAMDSHGGWIATASDLANFAAALDDPDNCPMLSAESIGLMHRRPPGSAGHEDDGQEKQVYYSLGWNNRTVATGKANHWHTGSLPGTATILIRRHDGKNFVALLNCRVSPKTEHLGREIDQLLHHMANEVTDWPE